MANTQKNRGGRPKADIARMATRLSQDLDAAALDPGLVVSKAAVCERTGIGKSTLELYAADPRIAPFLERLKHLQEARRAAKVLVSEMGHRAPSAAKPAASPVVAATGPAAIDDHQIAQRYAQATQKVSCAAQRLTARFRRVEHVSDLSAATYHLEIAVQQLHGMLAELRPLAREWVQRRGGVAPPPPEQHELLLDDPASPDGM